MAKKKKAKKQDNMVEQDELKMDAEKKQAITREKRIFIVQ